MGQVAIGNEKSNITVLATICGNGKWLPPLMLLPYKRLPSSVVEKIPDWVIAGTSPSGWINSESLYEYLCNAFDKWLTDNSVERPVIVWSDWHSTRLNYHTISETLERGIVLLGLPKNTTHIMQPLDTHLFGPLKARWKETVASLSFEDIELKKDNFGEHFFKFYETFMNEHSGVISKSFKDTGLCPLNPDRPRYTKLKSKEKGCRATEGVEFKVPIKETDWKSKKSFKMSSTQTVSAGFSRGTNTSPLKMECAPGKDEQDKPTATYDDMLLFLATHKTEKLAVINRAKNTFGECAKQQSVIRSRSDLFISDVFFNHKFFPSPSLPQTGKRKQKVKKVELLPNVISSKEWKEYALSKKMEKNKKEGTKRKIDSGKSDCPNPKRRPGRPRKIPVDITHAASSSREKSPNQQSNESGSDGVAIFATPDIVKPEPLISTFRITNIAKPKRLWTGEASAVRVGDLKKCLRWENEENSESSRDDRQDKTEVDCSNELEVGEYVVILCKETEVPGRITKCLRNGKSTISLMEASLRPRGWKWPVKPQIASIFKLDVRKRLDSPEFVMSHGNEIVFSFNGI